MNLDELKGKTLDDALHAELVKHVGDLEAKVQSARDESINHRKGLKTKVEELERTVRTTFEKLGIDSIDELEQLPDAKGQAEALKQFDVRVKRLERENSELTKQRDEMSGLREKDRRTAAIAQAVAKHEFADPEVATLLLERGLKVEGEQIMFEADGGKLVPLDEGAAWIAKSKPHLVKAQGGTGSGYRPGGNGSGQPTKKPERKDYTDEVAYFRDSAKYQEWQQQQQQAS